MTDPRMTPTNDAPVTVGFDPYEMLRKVADVTVGNLVVDAMTIRELLAIESRHRLAALASAPAGDGVEAAAILRRHVVVETAPIDDATVSAIIAAMQEYAALARPRAAVGEREA